MGAPVIGHPIYFFLGDMADGLDPSRPESIRLPLAALPADKLTFTFPDSMASLPLGLYDEHASDRRSHHGKVFTIEEIGHVIAEFGMPCGRRRTIPPVKYDHFIEGSALGRPAASPAFRTLVSGWNRPQLRG